MNRKLENTMDMVIFPYNEMEKFNGLMKQYGNMPSRQIYREIARVKNDISKEVIDQHIKNLDALSAMGGFVTEEQKGKMERVKTLLKSETAYQVPGSNQSSSVETEFVSGTSLLLWFLILVAIW